MNLLAHDNNLVNPCSPRHRGTLMTDPRSTGSPCSGDDSAARRHRALSAQWRAASFDTSTGSAMADKAPSMKDLRRLQDASLFEKARFSFRMYKK